MGPRVAARRIALRVGIWRLGGVGVTPATRKRVIAVAGLLGFAALLLWQHQRAGGRGIDVDVATVSRAALASTTLASGSLVYAQQIQLRSQVTGRVAEVLVEEGERVRKGQVLMRLDPEAFDADLASAGAGVRAAEIEIESRRSRAAELTRQLDRQRVLFARHLVSRESFEQLANETELAQIAVRAAVQALHQQQAQQALARDRLERSVFSAPIDGLLVSVDVKPGETVIAGTVNIVGSDLVDEADIAQVQLGQSVNVFAAAYPQQALQGEVVHIGTSARQLGSAQSLAFRVRVQLAPQQLSLHPGMSCRAEILTAQGEPTRNVPVAAIQRDKDGQFVWRVNADERVERVPVTLGMANDFDQAVDSTLSDGERVVTGPGRVIAQLKAGDRIRAKSAKAEGAATSAESAK
ncbi:MAG: efflux transporter periplasmic adaptor subunit [Gammaproteobacteria bacterium HGW-Gammaproteobacteria-1]|nr:MAG: efflux transporter periplasmic adaptor subunit [Gammaproteobacteria bacterium HGW-Gammaproteobacteria-1]